MTDKKKIAESVIKKVKFKIIRKCCNKIFFTKKLLSSRRIPSEIFGKKIICPLVDTNWLEENLDKVKIIDLLMAHALRQNVMVLMNIKTNHIKNAIFFDLDKNSKKRYRSTSYVNRC